MSCVLILLLLSSLSVIAGNADDWDIGDSVTYSYSYLLETYDNSTNQMVPVQSYDHISVMYELSDRNSSDLKYDMYLEGNYSRSIIVDSDTSISTSKEDLHFWTDTADFSLGPTQLIQETLIFDGNPVVHDYNITSQAILETSEGDISYWELDRQAFNYTGTYHYQVLQSSLRISDQLGLRLAESFGLIRYSIINQTYQVDTRVSWVMNIRSYSGLDLIPSTNYSWMLIVLIPLFVLMVYRMRIKSQ